MAKLVAVCRDELDYPFQRRQIPLTIEDTLTMVMEIPESFAVAGEVSDREIEVFTERYNSLSLEELSVALTVLQKEVFSLLSTTVPCVGCRRSVERLYGQLVEYGQPALEPLVVLNSGVLTVSDSFLKDASLIYTLFYVNGSKLTEMVEAIPKSKRNRRCLLHSLETHKPRPSSVSWTEVWDLLSQECKDEVVLVDSEALLDTLENYLRKHRFCVECKSKVLQAYRILNGDVDGASEKGYCAALYDGLKSCPQERHIHVLSDTDFIAHLIGRAESEIVGGKRERHAKTIDIAQEEVLTCLGVYLWERFHRLWQKLRAEEQTWQMLFYLGVEALRKNFELAMEDKQGISRLEQAVEEISEAERVKELKREQKRLKKKAKKKDRCKKCQSSDCDMHEERIVVEEDCHSGQLQREPSPDISSDNQNNSQENGYHEETPEEEELSAGHHHNISSGKSVSRSYVCGYSGEEKKWTGVSCDHDHQNSLLLNDYHSCHGQSADDKENGHHSQYKSESSSSTEDLKQTSKNGKKKKQAKNKAKKNCVREKLGQDNDDEEIRLLRSMGWTQDDCKEGSVDDAEGISEQEILQFNAKYKQVSDQRQELRQKLRQQFDNLSLKVEGSTLNHPVSSVKVTVVH